MNDTAHKYTHSHTYIPYPVQRLKQIVDPAALFGRVLALKPGFHDSQQLGDRILLVWSQH